MIGSMREQGRTIRERPDAGCYPNVLEGNQQWPNHRFFRSDEFCGYTERLGDIVAILGKVIFSGAKIAISSCHQAVVLIEALIQGCEPRVSRYKCLHYLISAHAILFE